ncbi:MAG TPA: ECF transporter S component [Erysipelotrichaceae bacterium]|nr:ECF transporter S component [Erysipelotrichaceae bacterium]
MQNNSIRQLTLTAFFIAIQVVMTLTPIGYLPIGAISITTMHIPVILSGIFLGAGHGALIGFVFGLTSMLRATFSPGITSFLFSPFITVGGISGNFYSLIIVFGPRILLGWMSGKLFRILRKKIGNLPSCAVTAAVSTITHTILVMGMIYLFFAPQYAQALNISRDAVAGLIIGVITSNGILETILAGIVIPALDKALWPIVRRMRLGD